MLSECPSICQLDYSPVCGTDGETYGNSCALEVAACKNSEIKKAHDGECWKIHKIINLIAWKQFCFE